MVLKPHVCFKARATRNCEMEPSRAALSLRLVFRHCYRGKCQIVCHRSQSCFRTLRRSTYGQRMAGGALTNDPPFLTIRAELKHLPNRTWDHLVAILGLHCTVERLSLAEPYVGRYCLKTSIRFNYLIYETFLKFSFVVAC